MFVTLLINVAVMKYERKKGRELSSDILICDALHTRSDIFASLAVIGTLVSIKIGFSFLDVIIAGLIAVLIAKSGLQILKASSDVLCDASVLERARIADIVNKIPGVKSVHKIRTRGRKDDIYVDLHISIDADMSVDDAHDISHKIEKSLKKKIPGITDVISHVEPSR